MARPLRIEFSGACYHVINRGNYRSRIFSGKGAAEAFERTLAEAAERFRWSVHAYVVMNNHFHLVVEIDEPNLSVGMKWLQGTWVRRFNGLRQQTGRPFQGRYKALIVKRGHRLAQVCDYIHLNPVRARLTDVENLPGYACSSLPKFMRKRGRAHWLQPEVLLQEAGRLADTPKGWQTYLDHLSFLMEDEPSRREMTSRKMSRGWCLGDPQFKQEMKELMPRDERDPSRFAGLEPAEIKNERQALWEEDLQELAKLAGINLKKLGPRKSDPAKVLLAAALKSSSSVSNGWLAQRLEMGQPASASQFVRRCLLDKKKSRAVRQLLSRVKRGSRA